MHHQILAEAYGIYFPEQRLNLGSLHWKGRVLATGPPGKTWLSDWLSLSDSPASLSFFKFIYFIFGWSLLLLAGFLQLRWAQSTLVTVRGLLIAVASFVAKHRL